MESENLRSGILNFWKIQGAQRVTFSILNLSLQMHNHLFFIRNFKISCRIYENHVFPQENQRFEQDFRKSMVFQRKTDIGEEPKR